MIILFSFIVSLPAKRVYASTAVDYEMQELSSSYDFELTADGYHITKYKGNEKNLELPDYYNGIPVTGIADVSTGEVGGAFYGKDILQVKLGKNINFIGRGAFRDCARLEKVIMNDKVEVVNSYAFYNCSSLYEIDFPELKQVGLDILAGSGWFNKLKAEHNDSGEEQEDYYYQNENNKILLKVVKIVLDSYKIEEGTTCIAQQAFHSSLSISKLEIPSSLKYLGHFVLSESNIDQNTDYDILTFSGTTLDEFSKNVVFGQHSFSLIGKTYNEPINARSAKYIGKTLVLAQDFIAEDFVVVDGTVKIANAAFLNCEKIKRITIPASVTYIGENAFYSCKNLEEVVIEGEVTLADSAFLNCSKLKTVSGKITEVGSYAFYGCTSLQNIDLSGVKTIKGNAFRGATDLQSVTIGDDAEVCASAFINTAITNGKSGQIFIGDYLIGVGEDVESLTLNDKIIAQNALQGSNLVSVNLTNVRLGKGAFLNCKRLESVTFDGTTLPDDCFNGAIKLNGINATVTSIGDRALQNTAITSIDLSHVEAIGENAFSGSKLSQVSLNASARLKDYAFFNVPLTEITVDSGNNLYTSENGILFNKDKTEIVVYPAKKVAQTVELPASVLTIGKGAFAYAENIGSLTGEFTKINAQAFYGANIAQIDTEKVDELGDKAFYQSKVSSLSLPLLREAGYKAFAYSALTSINLTNNQFNRQLGILKGATELKELKISFNYIDSDSMNLNLGYLFGADYFDGSNGGYQKYSEAGSLYYYLPKIEKVTVTDGKVSVGAFMNMKHLKTVVLEENVLGLGSSAFSGCEALEEVSFSSAVTSVGRECFSGCKSLTDIDLNGIARVDDFAFKGCKSLNSISIGDELVFIGNGAFSQCDSLKNVQIESRAFFNNYDNSQTDYGLLFENAENVLVGAEKLSASEIKSLREINGEPENKLNKTKIIIIVSACATVLLVAVYFVVRHFRLKSTDDFTRPRSKRRRRH